MTSETGLFEALLISQGFENRVDEFTMDDFRGERLPNYEEPANLRYRIFYYIEMCKPGSRCHWGHSRWVTGETGKLKYLDDDYDTSG